jgi:hypothetical protein
VGIWLFFADDGAVGEEEMVRQNNGPYTYQLAAMFVFLFSPITCSGESRELGRQRGCG